MGKLRICLLGLAVAVGTGCQGEGGDDGALHFPSEAAAWEWMAAMAVERNLGELKIARDPAGRITEFELARRSAQDPNPVAVLEDIALGTAGYFTIGDRRFERPSQAVDQVEQALSSSESRCSGDGRVCSSNRSYVSYFQLGFKTIGATTGFTRGGPNLVWDYSCGEVPCLVPTYATNILVQAQWWDSYGGSLTPGASQDRSCWTSDGCTVEKSKPVGLGFTVGICALHTAWNHTFGVGTSNVQTAAGDHGVCF